MPPSLIWVLWSKTVPQHYLLHTTCWQKSTPTAYLAEDRCCDSVTGASHCTKYSCCRCIPLSTWCWSCPSCSLWPWCHNTHWSLCHAGTSSCSFIVLGRKSASSLYCGDTDTIFFTKLLYLVVNFLLQSCLNTTTWTLNLGGPALRMETTNLPSISIIHHVRHCLIHWQFHNFNIHFILGNFLTFATSWPILYCT